MQNHGLFKTGMVAMLALEFLRSTSALAAETYSFDKGHTEIRVSWNHAGLSMQSARFLEFDGTIVIDEDDPAKSSVDISLNVSGIKSTIEAFDNELKSANFFDLEKFPTITFKSTAVRQTAKQSVEITGDLIIKGVKKPVKLDADLIFIGPHPLGPYIAEYKGAKYAGFQAKARVLRSEFGLGAFAPLTSDWVDININTELRKQ